MTLNKKQQEAFDLVKSGMNTFITGPAGTGKSFLIDHIRENLDADVTASTGIAATNISGQTIHSWAGIFPFDDHYRHSNKPETVERIAGCKTLIIDEISMIDDYLLNYLDKRLKGVNYNKRTLPFGGIQIVVVGDFMQLPPVNSKANYCFMSESWDKANFKYIKLDKVERQKKKEMAEFLDHVRYAKFTSDDYKIFSRIAVKGDFPDDYVKLYPKNKECDIENKAKLNAIDSLAKTFTATVNQIRPELIGNSVEKFLKDSLISQEIILKKGARVMLLKNKDVERGLCNGAVGIIKEFKGDFPIVEFDNGEILIITNEVYPIQIKHEEDNERKNIKVAEIRQIPLRLSWAITIHKCVSKNTIVNCDNIGYNKIENVTQGQMINDGRGSYNKVLNKSEKLIKNGYKITTHCGYELTCGEDHPILINDGNSEYFKKLKDIKESDKICIDRTIHEYKNLNGLIQTPINGRELIDLNLPKTISNEFAWFLGYTVGDGSYNDKKDGRIEITTNEFDIVQRVEKILKNIGLNTTIRQKKNSTCYSIYTHSTQFRRFLLLNGLDYNIAGDKKIPACILKSSSDNVSAFLQGLFDADGSASNSLIRFTSKSITLIKQVQMLLLGFGAVSYITNATNNNYQLVLTNTSSINFKNNIDFSIDYKKISAGLICRRSIARNMKTSIDFIPDGKQILSNVRRESKKFYGKSQGIKGKGLFAGKDRKIKHIFGTSLKNISYSHLKYIFKNIEINNDDLNTRIVNNYFYDRIKKIENLNKKIEMYDIEVENSNSFFANGLVAHNSQGMSLDRVGIEFKGIFAPFQAYVALSRCRDLEHLKIRNMAMYHIKVDQEAVEFMNNL